MKYSLSSPLPEDFGLETAKQVMEARGYKWVHRFLKEKLQLAEEIWLLPDDRGAVRYVYDHIMEVPMIYAESDIPCEPGRILIDLNSDLPFLGSGDLIKQALSTSSKKFYALRALASSIDYYDGRVIKAFKAAIQDQDPRIRGLAEICMARYRAFEFVQMLEDQASVEPLLNSGKLNSTWPASLGNPVNVERCGSHLR